LLVPQRTESSLSTGSHRHHRIYSSPTLGALRGLSEGGGERSTRDPPPPPFQLRLAALHPHLSTTTPAAHFTCPQVRASLIYGAQRFPHLVLPLGKLGGDF